MHFSLCIDLEQICKYRIEKTGHVKMVPVLIGPSSSPLRDSVEPTHASTYGYTRSLRLSSSLGHHGPQANPVFHRALRGRLRHARGQAPQYRAARAQHADLEARRRTATDTLRTRPARHGADRGGAPDVSPVHADHARHRARARSRSSQRDEDDDGSHVARDGGVGTESVLPESLARFHALLSASRGTVADGFSATLIDGSGRPARCRDHQQAARAPLARCRAVAGRGNGARDECRARRRVAAGDRTRECPD